MCIVRKVVFDHSVLKLLKKKCGLSRYVGRALVCWELSVAPLHTLNQVNMTVAIFLSG